MTSPTTTFYVTPSLSIAAIPLMLGSLFGTPIPASRQLAVDYGQTAGTDWHVPSNSLSHEVQFLQKVTRLYNSLIASQTDLSDEAKDVLYSRLGDLYL